MRGYDRNEPYEDLDEYEEDGEDLEHEGTESEEEEEEEQDDPQHTKEEIEYLEMRRRLKEKARQRLRKESATTVGNSQEKKKLPYDNYGSFFGPSKPVIARRVLEESRSILETRSILAKAPSPNSASMKGPTSANGEAKHNVRVQPPKGVNQLKTKVQKLKDTRDYSFLFSEDADFPTQSKEPAPRNVPVRSFAQVPPKSQLSSISKPVKPISIGRQERNSTSINRPMQTKVGHPKTAPMSRPASSSADPRKMLGSNSGNGPGRPVGPKGPFSKAPAMSLERKNSAISSKTSLPAANKAPLAKPQATIQKNHLEQKKEHHRLDKPKVIPKQPVIKPKMMPKQSLLPKQSPSSSKPQMKPPKKISPHVREDRPKKRPMRQNSDEDMDDGDEAIRMIRSMFRYNPGKYADVDDDVSDMEANFDDIQEEELESAKIAKEEDERELRLIEEEERRMRMRKEAKKRKLSHH